MVGDRQSLVSNQCTHCEGVGALVVSNGPLVICPKCEGVGRVLLDGRPARIVRTEICEPPPLLPEGS